MMLPRINRILVTGGAGFIGSHTVDALLKLNKEVVVLDNLFSGKLTNLNLTQPNLEFIEGDVLEFPYLKELMSSCDAVLHLAAIASVPYSIQHPIYSFQVNVQGFLHVLEGIRQLDKRIRLVYASSAAVYGDIASLPCQDNVPLTSPALSPYALQKVQIEQYADLYERLHGVKSVGLRYFNVYGERQDPSSPYSGVISRFLAAYQADQPIKVYGDGSQSRDFIAVSDVVKANLAALSSEVSGAVNIATGVQETLSQLIEYMQAVGNKPLNVQHLPQKPGDIKHSYGAIDLAETLLDFKAEIPLKKGIQAMLSLS